MSTSTKLPAAKPLCFPSAVLDQHLVMLGKTGSGKSSKLRHIVEHLLAKGKRVCVVDPKGDWWGLKVAADGKGPGFPVILFGDFKDERAQDVPINDRSGKHIAELVATGNRPCIIGMRGWSQGAMVRFWIDFAEALFSKNAGELYLVGDEFHNFAPKQWKGQSDRETPVGVALHWSNRLLSEGRGLGLVCLLASQRPQKVHNDTLTSCETLASLRVVHAADRAAIKAWIDGNGDAAVGNEVLSSLASMPREESWLWSPEVGFGPKRITFPLFVTFDSFAPPQLQKRVSGAGWADVDLEEVKTTLAGVIEEAKANDPKSLRLRVRELEQQLARASAAKPVAAPAVKEKVVEKPVITDKQLDRLEKMQDKIMAAVETWWKRAADGINPLMELLNGQRGELAQMIAAVRAIKNAPVASPYIRPGMAIATSPTTGKRFPSIVGTVTATKPVAAKAAVLAGDFTVTPAMQKILDSLAWWEVIGQPTPERGAAAVMAGYSVNGHFNNLCGALRTAGLIDYPGGGTLQLTDAGRGAANTPSAPGTLADVHAAWRNKLDNAQWRLVEPIIQNHPRPMEKEDLAAAAGYTVNGHFNNLLGSLRSLGVVHKRSPVSATNLLFPDGLI